MKTFEEVWPTLPGTGWLAQEEARLLWDSAKQYEGAILEVGCYFGRSTVLLASLGRPLYCVDPFDGFTDDYTGDYIHLGWQENLRSRDLIDNIMLFKMRVEDLVSRPPVGFAYLDGDHTAEGTKTQIRVAEECGTKAIAIHDVNDSGEGLAIKQVALEMLGPWKSRVERLATWRL